MVVGVSVEGADEPYGYDPIVWMGWLGQNSPWPHSVSANTPWAANASTAGVCAPSVVVSAKLVVYPAVTASLAVTDAVLFGPCPSV